MNIWQLGLASVSAGGSLLIGLRVEAQLLPDGTLGDEPSVVVPGAEVRGLPAELMEGGALRDSSLFHSFGEFNVDLGQRVYFANPDGVENIFNRVTGRNPSNVFGTLGVDGPASLFLLNPNGILFGPEASLDIEGSFFATTAERLEFGDGVSFSAVEPGPAPILQVAVPLGLQGGPAAKLIDSGVEEFAVAQAGFVPEGSVIESRGELRVGGDLGLLADGLDLEGQVVAGGDLVLRGTDGVRIRDSVDEAFVGASRGALLVQGDEVVDIFALNNAGSGLGSGGDMVLRSAEQVIGNAHFVGRESFLVEDLKGNAGNILSPVALTVKAFRDVKIKEYVGDSLHIFSGGATRIATITIDQNQEKVAEFNYLKENIELSDGTIVVVDGRDQSILDIRAGVSHQAIESIPLREFELSWFRSILPNDNEIHSFPSNANIEIEDVAIMAPGGLILLTNQYRPNVELDGNIKLESKFSSVFGFGGIDASNFGGRTIAFDSRNNIMVIGSTVAVTSFENELSHISFLANEKLTLSNPKGLFSGLFSNSLVSSGSKGGNIRIKANELDVLDGTQVLTTASESGDAGDILLDIGSVIKLDGVSTPSNLVPNPMPSNLGSVVLQRSMGKGGTVRLTVPNLEVTNGARIDASTGGPGDAGNLILNVGETAHFDGAYIANSDFFFLSSANSSVYRQGTGLGGSIQLNAKNLEITNGAAIVTSTFGMSDAGNIAIDVNELARFDGTTPVVNISASGIRSSVDRNGNGRGGNVELKAANLEITNGGQINASSFGIGKAGNVDIDIVETVSIDGASPLDGLSSKISSSVEAGATGKGGDVHINAGNLHLLNGAQINSVVFGTGEAGNIDLDIRKVTRFLGTNPFDETSSGAFGRISVNGFGVAGDISLNTSDLILIDEAGIFSDSLGSGRSANILVNASNEILLVDGRIETQSLTNTAGQIRIITPRLLMEANSNLQSSVNSGIGEGGGIYIAANSILAFDDSDILSFADIGRGGDIIFDTRAFFGENYISGASAPFDNNDRVDINASGTVNGVISLPDVTFIQDSLTDLPESILNPDTLVANSCVVRTAQETQGQFLITGTGGLPTKPSDPPAATYSTGTIRNTEASVAETSRLGSVSYNPIEPQGLYRLTNGRLVLSRECDKQPEPVTPS